MFKKFPLLMLFGLVASVLAACEKPLQVDPRETAAGFYQLLQAQDFDGASGRFDDGMFRSVPRAAWVDFLGKVQQELGGLNGIRIRNVETNTVRTGRIFIFDISAEYENGNASETLTMFQALSATGLTVIDYDVKATGLKSAPPN